MSSSIWLGPLAVDRQLQEAIETDNVQMLRVLLDDDDRDDVMTTCPSVVSRCLLQSIGCRSLQCVGYLLGDDRSPGPGSSKHGLTHTTFKFLYTSNCVNSKNVNSSLANSKIF